MPAFDNNPLRNLRADIVEGRKLRIWRDVRQAIRKLRKTAKIDPSLAAVNVGVMNERLHRSLLSLYDMPVKRGAKLSKLFSQLRDVMGMSPAEVENNRSQKKVWAYLEATFHEIKRCRDAEAHRDLFAEPISFEEVSLLISRFYGYCRCLRDYLDAKTISLPEDSLPHQHYITPDMTSLSDDYFGFNRFQAMGLSSPGLFAQAQPEIFDRLNSSRYSDIIDRIERHSDIIDRLNSSRYSDVIDRHSDMIDRLTSSRYSIPKKKTPCTSSK